MKILITLLHFQYPHRFSSSHPCPFLTLLLYFNLFFCNRVSQESFCWWCQTAFLMSSLNPVMGCFSVTLFLLVFWRLFLLLFCNYVKTFLPLCYSLWKKGNISRDFGIREREPPKLKLRVRTSTKSKVGLGSWWGRKDRTRHDEIYSNSMFVNKWQVWQLSAMLLSFY